MITVGGRAHTVEEAKEVARMGYRFVEISLENPDTVSISALEALKRRYGVYYLAHYPNEDNPFDPEILREKYIPRMKELLAMSRDLEIEKGTIHFSMDMNWIRPDVFAEKIEMLGELVEYAESLGIVLCIENLSEDSSSFNVVLDAVKKLRMTLDIGHAELLCTKNKSFDFIGKLFEKIAHVHVHDNRGGNSVRDDLHLPLGRGNVDFPRIFSLLRERGYCSTLTMEVPVSEMPSTLSVIRDHLEVI